MFCCRSVPRDVGGAVSRAGAAAGGTGGAVGASVAAGRGTGAVTAGHTPHDRQAPAKHVRNTKELHLEQGFM